MTELVEKKEKDASEFDVINNIRFSDTENKNIGLMVHRNKWFDISVHNVKEIKIGKTKRLGGKFPNTFVRHIKIIQTDGTKGEITIFLEKTEGD